MEAAIHTPVTPALLDLFLNFILPLGPGGPGNPIPGCPTAPFSPGRPGLPGSPGFPLSPLQIKTRQMLTQRLSSEEQNHPDNQIKIHRLLYLGVQGNQVVQEGHLPQEVQGAI